MGKVVYFAGEIRYTKIWDSSGLYRVIALLSRSRSFFFGQLREIILPKNLSIAWCERQVNMKSPGLSHQNSLQV